MMIEIGADNLRASIRERKRVPTPRAGEIQHALTCNWKLVLLYEIRVSSTCLEARPAPCNLLGTVIPGLGFHDPFKVGVKFSEHYFL